MLRAGLGGLSARPGEKVRLLPHGVGEVISEEREERSGDLPPGGGGGEGEEALEPRREEEEGWKEEEGAWKEERFSATGEAKEEGAAGKGEVVR